MKVFLTGATGYVGHKLANKLADQNYLVHALVRDINSPKIPQHKNIKVFKGNICNYTSVENAIKGCEYVFHTAAYTNIKSNNLETFYKTNVIGTEHVLKAALNNNVKKVVYTSTLAVFGASYKKEPITETQPRLTSYSNDYELTKSMSEELVDAYVKKGLNVVVLNVSRVYGPGLATFSNGVSRLIKTFLNSRFLFVPNKLKVAANYVYINDVVEAHLKALTLGVKGENYIIGGENLSYKQLFNTITELTKTKTKIVQVNYSFLKFSFSVLNLLRKTLGMDSLISAKVIDSLFTNRVCSSRKAMHILNFKPTSLRSGLNETINHLSLSK